MSVKIKQNRKNRGHGQKSFCVQYAYVRCVMKWMFRNNADVRRCSYFELGLPVGKVSSPLIEHPRRPRGSQSGREKRQDESFQVQAKEPLGTYSHRTISKNSKRCRLLFGHKKCFVCYWAQSANSSSWVLFGSSYTTAIVSITACPAHAPKECTQSRNFQFDIKSPSDFKILSARKVKTLFQKYKLELTVEQVFTLASVKRLA